MTESVEWERLADHDASMPAPRPSLCDYCGMDRRVHDSRTWMAHCEATAAAHPDALKQMRAERDAARRELAEVSASLAIADRTIRDQRDELNHLSGAGIVPTVQIETRDAAGWTAAESAEFEELYGVQAAMYLRAANDRVWEIVKELRNAAVADGRNPYKDPMAQRLSAALIGERKAADGG